MSSNTQWPSDYHIHTALCKHATGSVKEYIQSAIARGLHEMAFTDHAPAPDGYDAANRMTLEQFSSYRRMVTEAAESAGITVLFGVEADYYDGCETFLTSWLAQQKFDLVLGSIHYIGSWGFDNDDRREQWASVDVPTAWRSYFEILGRLADTRLYDIVGHLDIAKKYGYRIPDALLKELAAPALDKIAAAGMAIEINTGGLRKPVQEIYPSPLILRMARGRNIPITFGSDSHAPRDVGFDFRKAIELARNCGYSQSVRFRNRHSRPAPLPET